MFEAVKIRRNGLNCQKDRGANPKQLKISGVRKIKVAGMNQFDYDQLYNRYN